MDWGESIKIAISPVPCIGFIQPLYSSIFDSAD